MLSKNQQKHIRQLSQKEKNTFPESGLFIAEGEKLVNELLDSGWKADQIYTTVPLQKTPHTIVDPSVLKKYPIGIRLPHVGGLSVASIQYCRYRP